MNSLWIALGIVLALVVRYELRIFGVFRRPNYKTLEGCHIVRGAPGVEDLSLIEGVKDVDGLVFLSSDPRLWADPSTGFNHKQKN